MGKWNGGIILGYQTMEISSSTHKNKETRLVIVPDEANLVRYIFDLYASGKGLKAITNQINHENYKTKKNNPFSVNGVKDILHNPTYIGKIRYNVRENWSEKRRKGINPEPIIVDGEHEAIVDISTFEKVQELYKKKSGRPKRTFDGSYLLTGLLRCPVCGHGMVAGRVVKKRKDGSKYILRYYYCGAWRNKGSSVCKSNGIKAEIAENYVFNRLEAVLCNEVVLKDLIGRLNDGRVEKIKPYKEELVNIDKNIKNAALKREKYFKLFEESIIDKMLLASKLEEISGEIERLESRKQILSSSIEENNVKSLPYELIKDVLLNYKQVLNEAATEEKKLLLQLVIKEITISKDRNVKSLKLKFDENIVKYIVEKGGSPDGGGPPFFMSRIGLLENVRFTITI
jgi:site-specific DNA recombinase